MSKTKSLLDNDIDVNLDIDSWIRRLPKWKQRKLRAELVGYKRTLRAHKAHKAALREILADSPSYLRDGLKSRLVAFMEKE